MAFSPSSLCTADEAQHPPNKKHKDEDLHTHTQTYAHNSVFCCIIGLRQDLTLLSLMVNGLHPWVSRRVSDSVSHGSGRLQPCLSYGLSVHCQTLTCTITLVQANTQHSDLSASFTAVGYTSSICSFSSADDKWVVSPPPPCCFPGFSFCQIKAKGLWSPQDIVLLRAFLAALPWQTVRLHSDYRQRNIVWQPPPREGLTIMFH